MKKFLVVALSVVLLSGCGKTETLTCRTDNTVGTLTSRTTYTIEHMNNKVRTIKVTYDYSDNHTNGVGTGTDEATEGDDTSNRGNDAGTGTNGTTNNNENNNHVDGVGTGTDGTTEDDDTEGEDNDIIGGTVGEALDDVVTGVANTAMDITGVKNMHNTRYNNYNNIEGFTRSIDTDNDNNYKITYTYDLSKLSDNDMTTLGISRNLDTLRSTYTNRGLTCR